MGGASFSTERQREIPRLWRQDLTFFRTALPILHDTIAFLRTGLPLDPIAPELASRMSELCSKTNYGYDRIVLQAYTDLLRLHPVDAFHFPPEVIALARDQCKGAWYNAVQLLGFAFEAEMKSYQKAADLCFESGLTETRLAADDMVLLAQFSTCYGGWGAMFGDCDRLGYYIPRTDLEAERFDRAVALIN